MHPRSTALVERPISNRDARVDHDIWMRDEENRRHRILSRCAWMAATISLLSRRRRLPVSAAVQEQIDAIIRPYFEFGLGHRCAEAKGATLRRSDNELEELLGGEFRAADREAAGLHLPFEQGGDLLD
jgi:hypothetical protein